VPAVGKECLGQALGRFDPVSLEADVVPPAHVSAALARSGPGVKSLPGYSISRKLQKIFKPCKNHRKFSVTQKNVYNISKCSEK
jgi:hypothetical protein